jgi:hypothetical protein
MIINGLWNVFTLVATLVDTGSGAFHIILVINGGQSRPHLGSSLQGCE